MTREEFQRLVGERGGLAGPAVAVDPEIDNPSTDRAELRDRPKIPNPNPRFKYIFNNGTQLEAKGAGQLDADGRVPHDEQGPFEIQITDAGTALRPSSATSLEEGVSAPTDQRYIISRKPDGTLNTQENPNYKGEKDDKSTLQPFGNQLLKVNPDGTTTVIATKAADSKEPTTVAFGDTLYSFDGTKVTPLITKPKEPEKPTTEVRNGKTYQWDPASNTWSEAAGLPAEKKPSTASVNTTARYIVYYDDQGNEVSRNENPNYVPPTPTQLTADTVSPNIPLLKPDGTVEWVPNQNRVPASQAMQDLLGQVGVKVNGGNLSMADAKDLLSGTVNVMNAQTAQQNAATSQTQAATTAATGALSSIQQAAGTGAGVLQNRVTAAGNMLNSILGLAGQGQRSGNMGGGLMSAPAALGEALVGGIQGWTTELGGGQGVYDTAARLVQQADPTNSPLAQTAYGVLGQMLERYQQQTGQPHPLVAATNATNASAATGGLQAPVTTPTPAPAPGGGGMPAWASTPIIVNPQGEKQWGYPIQTGAAPVTPPPPGVISSGTFVAPQTGMASLFVPGNPFTAPVTVRPTVT